MSFGGPLPATGSDRIGYHRDNTSVPDPLPVSGLAADLVGSSLLSECQIPGGSVITVCGRVIVGGGLGISRGQCG